MITVESLANSTPPSTVMFATGHTRLGLDRPTRCIDLFPCFGEPFAAHRVVISQAFGPDFTFEPEIIGSKITLRFDGFAIGGHLRVEKYERNPN